MGRDPDTSLVGRTIAGKFAIESVIGGGAMGAVYRARQIALDKAVAIKVMHRELSRDPTYVARFLREAKAASRIDHPNSVRVLDFGEEPDGLLYLAMELLAGRDLYTLIREEGPLDAHRVGDILLQVLAAVAAAHETGVVHRDMKPENIMIQRGTDDEGRARDLVKVCDFGVAKITEQRGGKAEPASGPAITMEGLVVGTPEYMSPEQGRGEPLDARSDLYSVGVILYQMLVGRVPFEAETALGIVLKHVTEEPQPPSFVRAGVDPALEAICLRALKKKREERYQTARAMRADVRAAMEAHAVATGGVRSVTAIEAAALVTAATEPRAFEPSLDPSSPVAHSPTPAVVANAAPPPNPATADTAVAFDSTALRAIRRSAPAGAELPPVLTPDVLPRRRWAGIVMGVALLAAAFGAVAFELRGRTLAEPSPTPTPATASAGNAAASTASAAASVPAASAQRDSTPETTAELANGASAQARAHGTHHGGRAHGNGAATDGVPPNGVGAPAGIVDETAPLDPAGPRIDVDASAATTTTAAGASSTDVDAGAGAAIGSSAATAPSANVAPNVAPSPGDKWDPKLAKVTIGRVNAIGVSPETLRAAIPDAALQKCYRSALSGAGPRPPASDMTLHLEATDGGRVHVANLSGGPPIPKSAGTCVMRSMMGKSINEAGAPLLTADVELTFSVD